MTNQGIPPIETLPQMLESAARFAPLRGIAIFDRRGQNFERHSYTELLESAKDYAGRLSSLQILPGDRVLISLPTTWNLLRLYFGTVFCGAYPTLISHTGSFGGGNTYAEKIAAIANLLSAKAIFCDASTRNELAQYAQHDAIKLTVLPEELAKMSPLAGHVVYNPSPAELAFIQLSSGSTGRQRAIKISHASACHNARAIGQALHCRPYLGMDTGVSWLPLNHDMGLVGCLFVSILHGFDLWLLRPETFLARPKLWLQTLSERNATMTTAPNFAYQTCVERIAAEELAGMNLSSLRALMTGAEIIRPETCHAFQEKFATAGLRESVFVPCYGMAEATLAVTFDTSNRGLRTMPLPQGSDFSGGLQTIVSNGKAIANTQIRISVPARPTDILADGAVGEICVKGPGVFSGYYGETQEGDEVFHQEWLRTGDLGFLNNGELYLTGRCKDVLIIRGRNVMPNEMEWLAERELGGGGTERTCAFSIQGDSAGEQAVLVVEVRQDLFDSLAILDRAIKEKIGAVLGLGIADLVFVKRGQIPKTTSGKVQRKELRQRYLDGRIERLNAVSKE